VIIQASTIQPVMASTVMAGIFQTAAAVFQGAPSVLSWVWIPADTVKVTVVTTSVHYHIVHVLAPVVSYSWAVPLNNHSLLSMPGVWQGLIQTINYREVVTRLPYTVSDSRNYIETISPGYWLP
jgi:hypothetical protein